MPIDQVTRWFPIQVRECLKPEISVQAIDTQTGELVGVAINIIAEKTLKKSTSIAGEPIEKEGRGLLDILDSEKEPIMVELAKFLGILNQGTKSSQANPKKAETFFKLS